MHPLDRVRQVASLALAFLLFVQAAFCLAMLALSLTRMGEGAGWDFGTVLTFAGLTGLFGGASAFFYWFGRRAGR
jgi:hypothetical protein